MFSHWCSEEEAGLVGENEGCGEIMEGAKVEEVVQGSLWTKAQPLTTHHPWVPIERWVVGGCVEGKRRGGRRGDHTMEWIERIVVMSATVRWRQKGKESGGGCFERHKASFTAGCACCCEGNDVNVMM